MKKKKFQNNYTLKWISYFVFSLLSINCVYMAHAEKMDLQTLEVVIGKVENAFSKIPKDSPQRVPILVELGDLYSEKSRLLIIEEGKLSCDSCKESKKVRNRAIQFYDQAFPQLQGESKGQVALQLAHLVEQMGEQGRAKSIYENLVKNRDGNYSASTFYKAYSKIGDFNFADGQFEAANQNFNSSLQYATKYQQGMIQYKLAWTHLNQGLSSRAISELITILQNPELLVEPDGQVYHYSESLHFDVARDLVVFMAKGGYKENSIETLLKHSPQKETTNLLVFYGDELFRTGQADGAMKVWSIALNQKDFPDAKKAEIHLKVAGLYLSKNDFNSVEKHLTLGIASIKDKTCEEEKHCEVLQVKVLNLFKQWQRTKLNLTRLVSVYQKYNTMFPDVIETRLALGGLAKDLKMFDIASHSYAEAADLSKTDLRKTDELLTLEIAMSEQAKNTVLLTKSYQHYLEIIPNNKKSLDIRYKLAMISYNSKNYQAAFPQFRKLSADSLKLNPELSLKAADLSLDCLFQSKLDEELEQSAIEYAKIYSKSSLHFFDIARKSGLRQLENKKDPIQVAKKLKSINTIGASKSEIAFILEKQLWASELNKEYQDSIIFAAKLGMDKSTNPDTILKMAYLTEMAKQNPEVFLRKYLKYSKNEEKNNLVRVQLIKRSLNPFRELRELKKDLVRYPVLLGELVLWSYNKTKDEFTAKQYLANQKVKAGFGWSQLEHYMFLNRVTTFIQKIPDYHLRTESEALLQNSLQKKVSTITQLEKLSMEAFKYNDWSAKALTYSKLTDSYEKLYQDILSIPVPAHLTLVQQNYFKKALLSKALPYQKESAKLREKLNNIWNNKSEISDLIERCKDASSENILARNEAQLLMRISTNSVRSQLQEGVIQ